MNTAPALLMRTSTERPRSRIAPAAVRTCERTERSAITGGGWVPGRDARTASARAVRGEPVGRGRPDARGGAGDDDRGGRAGRHAGSAAAGLPVPPQEVRVLARAPPADLPGERLAAHGEAVYLEPPGLPLDVLKFLDDHARGDEASKDVADLVLAGAEAFAHPLLGPVEGGDVVGAQGREAPQVRHDLPGPAAGFVGARSR